ncbi:MAG: hypothetical protein KBA08_09635 [Firmicutes bacterium]|nr:hypothetical protein [Bacillota bacterium]
MHKLITGLKARAMVQIQVLMTLISCFKHGLYIGAQHGQDLKGALPGYLLERGLQLRV